MRSNELNGRADELFEALRSLQVPEYMRWLDAIAERLRSFGTFRNVLLVEDQKPAATDIRPFDDWQEVGRRIGRGVKGRAKGTGSGRVSGTRSGRVLGTRFQGLARVHLGSAVRPSLGLR